MSRIKTIGITARNKRYLGPGPAGTSLVVTALNNQGIWNSIDQYANLTVGDIYYLNIGNQYRTLGGINVSVLGIQIVSNNIGTATFTIIGGPAAFNQTITGDGTGNGYTVSPLPFLQ